MKLAELLRYTLLASATLLATERAAHADEFARRAVASTSAPVQRWFASASYRRLLGATAHLSANEQASAPVTIRLTDANALARLEAIESSDVALRRADGRILRVGPIVCASVTARGLDQLEASPFIERIELDSLAFAERTLDATVPEVEVPPVWHALPPPQTPLAGKGVTIALLDFGLDVMHPLLFRADGGNYDWIDTDGDGIFSPGTDGVDLDRNQRFDDGELLRHADAVAYDFLLGETPILDSDSGAFDLGFDHLYADSNGNGRRDLGTEDGFTEQDAAYGEPLFVADDVNNNGKLDSGERLVRLGSSKVATFAAGSQTWTRGVDLIASPGHTAASAAHGTSVAGILVGGEEGLSRLVGVAPDAEVLFGTADSLPSFSQMFSWAVGRNATLILGEISAFVWVHMDGSTNLETMISAAAEQGIPFVVPAGNLGNKKRYAQVTVDTAAPTTLAFDVPTDRTHHLIAASVHWLATDRTLRFELHSPSGSVVDLGVGATSTSLDSADIETLRDDSPRGTARFDIGITSGTAIETGEWGLVIEDVTPPGGDESPMTAHAFIWDDVGGMADGVNFGSSASEQHIVTYPATADDAITVASYVGQYKDGYVVAGSGPQGSLRLYSGRGTRIDGASLIDVAAPDNPLTATNSHSLSDGAPIPWGSYEVFGGTSAAAPHVAGVAALVKQYSPELDGDGVRQRIRDGARVDEWVVGDSTHAVEDLWGAGKVSAYRAVFGEPPPANTAPAIESEPVSGDAGDTLELAVTPSDAESAVPSLELRVDSDYDGSWDGDPVAGDQPITARFDEAGVYYVKVQVRDEQGATAATLVRVEVEEPTGCGCRLSDRGGRDRGSALLLLVAVMAGATLRRRT